MSKLLYFKQYNLTRIRTFDIKTVLFQVVQLSISMHFSSIWPIGWTLSGATTLGQSWSGSDGNEGVPYFPQSCIITGTSPSDCLVSYPGHSWGGVLLLCRDSVGVFCRPSWLDHICIDIFSLNFYHSISFKVRRTRPAGHCWRSKDELISDVLLWTPTYGRAKAGQPSRTYI